MNCRKKWRHRKFHSATQEAPITLTTTISRQTARPVQPRARGAVAVSAKPSDRGAVLDRLRQSGSLKCLFPRRRGTALEGVLVNTAGGITGGDAFQVEAQVGPESALTLTTQAAERAYRAQPGETGHLRTRISVATGAQLNWLPQETILFQNCALSRQLEIDLAPGASALVVEPLIFGRTAMGETVTEGRFVDRITLRRNARPLYLDAMRFDGDMQAQLDRPYVAAGARAIASLIYVAPDAQSHLTPLRTMLPDRAGASLIGDDLLVLRLLAGDGHDLRQSLLPILNRLTGDTLPRCWMI